MGAVMVRCPRTQREFRTGMEMDRDDFSLSPVFFARAYCPFCRREHEWFAQEAWVCDNPAPKARALGAQALADTEL